MEHLFYYSVVNIVARFRREMKPNGVKCFASGGASSGAPQQPGGRSWLRRLASLGCRCVLYRRAAPIHNPKNIGKKPSIVLLYNFINRQAAGTPKKKDKDTISLDYSSICYIASKIGWVSMKEIHKL